MKGLGNTAQRRRLPLLLLLLLYRPFDLRHLSRHQRPNHRLAVNAGVKTENNTKTSKSAQQRLFTFNKSKPP